MTREEIEDWLSGMRDDDVVGYETISYDEKTGVVVVCVDKHPALKTLKITDADMQRQYDRILRDLIAEM